MLRCSMVRIIGSRCGIASIFCCVAAKWTSNPKTDAAGRCTDNRAVQAFYADQFILPLPVGHRFPMSKYGVLRETLARELPVVRFQQAPAATDDELVRVHTPAYVDAVSFGTLSPAAQREIGFPWSEAMAERARRSVGATVAAARVAWSGEGLAGNLAGGTHHAYADKGSGFCVFNDVAVAARQMQAEGLAAGRGRLRVAVIDLDVHQGNGTARIFRDDPTVFTLSLHGEKNFPFRKEAGDLDVALPDGCDDDTYLQALDHALDELGHRFEPDLVFYLAGADPHEGDRLGRMALTYDGLEARDRRVFDWAWQRRLPTVLTMAGGYGRDISTTLAVQMATWRLATDYAGRWRARWHNRAP